jgi:hypothetical protein
VGVVNERLRALRFVPRPLNRVVQPPGVSVIVLLPGASTSSNRTMSLLMLQISWTSRQFDRRSLRLTALQVGLAPAHVPTKEKIRRVGPEAITVAVVLLVKSYGRP